MQSKGNKKQYLCPECGSPNISEIKMFGQHSGECNEQKCRTWWPWKWRIKVDTHATIEEKFRIFGRDCRHVKKSSGGRLKEITLEKFSMLFPQSPSTSHTSTVPLSTFIEEVTGKPVPPYMKETVDSFSSQ